MFKFRRKNGRHIVTYHGVQHVFETQKDAMQFIKNTTAQAVKNDINTKANPVDEEGNNNGI